MVMIGCLVYRKVTTIIARLAHAVNYVGKLLFFTPSYPSAIYPIFSEFLGKFFEVVWGHK